MADQITNYQCPACTGPLHFGAQSGMLECEYCGSSYSVEEMQTRYAQQKEEAAQANQAEDARQAQEESQWDASDLTDDWGQVADGMRAYNCPSCGAQLICEETTAATACPYCGNPTVVPGQFSGALRPDFVIPFKLEKKAAIEALMGHYKGKLLLPNTFRDQHTVEKIQGVYVPFWLYDGKVSGEYHYKVSRTHTFRQGDWQITETDHYHVARGGRISFEKVPVDASSKMPDEYMESIEPYDYSALTEFSTAYLPGFLADKYDVSAEESNRRADQRCVATLEEALSSTVVGYTSCVPLPGGSTRLERGKVHYALLPVWLLNVAWNGGVYLFAVNGQTGKTAGKLPVCKKKALAFFAKIAVPLSALGVLLALLIR